MYLIRKTKQTGISDFKFNASRSQNLVRVTINRDDSFFFNFQICQMIFEIRDNAFKKVLCGSDVCD